MGREIRNVPEGWVHPKNEYGNYQPMFDKTYKEAAEEWIKGLRKDPYIEEAINVLKDLITLH